MQNQDTQHLQDGRADYEYWQKEQLADQICDMASTIAAGMLVSSIDRARYAASADGITVTQVISEASVDQAISIRDEVNRRILGK